jgi:hypothetical protein
MEIFPSPLLQWEDLPAVYSCSLCLLKVCMENCISSLLWWKGLPASYCCRLCLLKVHVKSSTLLLPPSLVHSKHSTLCSMSFSVPCLLFSFLWGGGQSVQGDLLVYPRGGCGSTTCHLFAHLLVCVSHAGLSQHLAVWESSWFLSVMCHGEVLWRVGVWGTGILLLLGGFFHQVWPQHLSKIFDLWNTCCMLRPFCHPVAPPFVRFRMAVTLP